jgi:flagellar biosynthesis anti-sigma factor FlgM
VNVTPSNPQRSSAGQPSDATPARRPERTETAPAGAPRSPASGVELSSEARAFLKLRARLDQLPGSDHPERIARLRAAVQSGAYAVSAEDVAGAMLRDATTAGLLGLPPQA